MFTKYPFRFLQFGIVICLSSWIIFSMSSAQSDPPFNHLESIYAIEWNPQATQYAVARGPDQCDPYGHNILIFDVSSAILVHELAGNECAVTAIDWSNDGRYLASSASGASVFVWHTTTGSIVFQAYTGPDVSSANSIDWHPTRPMTFFAVANWGHVELFQHFAPEETMWIGTGRTDMTVARWADSTHVIVGRENGAVEKWNTDTNQPTRTIIQLNARIEELEIELASRQLAVSTSENELAIVDLDTEVLRLHQHFESAPRDLAWRPGEFQLAVVLFDSILILDTATGQILEEIEELYDPQIATWTPDGQELWYGGRHPDGQDAEIHTFTMPDETTSKP